MKTQTVGHTPGPRTKTQRDELRRFKESMSHTVSALLKDQARVAEISPRQAEQLGAIIARLNAWIYQ